MKKRGFTLAEVMVVLTVIGVLTAIMLPAAFHATPDEEAIKFKKAYNTLGTAIRELAMSDKYYSEKGLHLKADGTTAAKSKYLCQCIADVITTKKSGCDGGAGGSATTTTKAGIDTACSGSVPTSYIETLDGVKIYRGSSTDTDFSTTTSGGFYSTYTVLCIEVSGKKAGIGVRIDGKIMTSSNLDTYLAKDFQGNT